MWKEKLDQLLGEYCYDGNDANEACRFVGELLQLEIDRMLTDEPNATNTIRQYRDCEQIVHDYDTLSAELRT